MKKNLLLAALIFFSTKTYSIIFWQPYPIVATVTGPSQNQRVECSVYDSVLGSWQNFNTPYYNNSILIDTSSTTIIVFYTLKGMSFSPDSCYGFLTYDPVLHQFITFYGHHMNDFENTSAIWVTDNMVGIFTECCYDGFESSLFYKAYFYDIISHSWKGGTMVDSYVGDEAWCNLSIGQGTLFYEHYSEHNTYDSHSCGLYNPVSGSFTGAGGWTSSTCSGNQDGYFTVNDSWFTGNTDLVGSAYDALNNNWPSMVTNDASLYMSKNAFIYSDDALNAESYIGIYDDSLHTWICDTGIMVRSNLIIKDRVFTYSNGSATKLFFASFSPALHDWVKDSLLINGIDTIYIQNGTVTWIDNIGTTNIRGYIDSIGWGNYQTPLQLNLRIIDLSGQIGYPLIFVRDYSIGADSTWYDFGDGVTTLPGKQHSLWHLYKVNGNYVNDINTVLNYTVCIHAGTDSYCLSDSVVMCAVSGIATALRDTVCYTDSTELSLTGFLGSIQWQKKVNNAWVDQTGTGSDSSVYKLLPNGNALYRAVVTNGSCISVYSNEVRIVAINGVNPGIATSSADSICPGSSVDLALQGSVGSIQWQYFNGVNWINENGSCNTCSLYSAIPAFSKIYRAYVYNAGCADSSNQVTVTLLPSLPDPVTIRDTICPPGIVNLTATGSSGVYCWYNNMTGDSLLGTGAVFSPYIISNKLFWVSAVSKVYDVGLHDTLTGNTGNFQGNDYGLLFDAINNVTIEGVSIYPVSTGSVVIQLQNSLGVELVSKQFNISSPNTRKNLTLDFEVPAGTGYRLVVYTPTFSMQSTVSNVAFPYTDTSDP